jgi:archaellum component FlaC
VHTPTNAIAAEASITLESSGGDSEKIALELSQTKALLEAKDKLLHEARENELEAKAKLHEKNDELQTLRGGVKVATPSDADSRKVKQLEEQIQALQTEKSAVSNHTKQLQGQIDLLQSQAGKGGAKSRSCEVQ